jgi:hypothetical protein
MTSLSPAAQAVITASNCAGSRVVQLHIAAALRAAADQLINVNWSCEMWELRRDFYAIAAELEGVND